MIEVKEDYSLKAYNTFDIDVKCKYFVESDEEEALRAFVADYEWEPSEVLILGGGSNFLFTEDFAGTVFYPAMQGKEKIKENEEEVWVRIGAGVEWDDFVAWTVEQGWGGVENLSFIPGHVGAAPVQNVGAYGMEAGERIDRVVTGKYTALPLFLCAMLAMFVITFGPFGSWLQNGVSALIDLFSGWLDGTLTAASVSPVLISLVCDGIIAGVGGVLSFLPQIALLFFFLSFLEDSGYMSRAAFIMDRLLRRFGLSGKAFIPMLMGFGCSVPAIMGARTMENEKDRRMTILLVPFMSCSAKLPVYGMIAGAFFGPWAGLVIFGLYVLGMLVGILSGILFKRTLFAGEPAPFVLELPPYRLPSFENIATHVWQKVKGFLIKAGTLILLMSMVLWLLQSFDFSLHMVDDAAQSMLGTLGSWIAPIFAPLGFGFWQAAVALLTGLIAKEMVVSSLSMFYGFALTATSAQVAAAMTGFTPLSALSMLVFILLYVPCVAAVSTLAREMNSVKWTLFSIAWQLGMAYIAAFLVHTVGLLLGFV